MANGNWFGYGKGGWLMVMGLAMVGGLDNGNGVGYGKGEWLMVMGLAKVRGNS